MGSALLRLLHAIYGTNSANFPVYDAVQVRAFHKRKQTYPLLQSLDSVRIHSGHGSQAVFWGVQPAVKKEMQELAVNILKIKMNQMYQSKARCDQPVYVERTYYGKKEKKKEKVGSVTVHTSMKGDGSTLAYMPYVPPAHK